MRQRKNITMGRLRVNYLTAHQHDILRLHACDICAIHAERATGQRLQCYDFCIKYLGQNAYFFRDDPTSRSKLSNFLQKKARDFQNQFK